MDRILLGRDWMRNLLLELGTKQVSAYGDGVRCCWAYPLVVVRSGVTPGCCLSGAAAGYCASPKIDVVTVGDFESIDQ